MIQEIVRGAISVNIARLSRSVRFSLRAFRASSFGPDRLSHRLARITEELRGKAHTLSTADKGNAVYDAALPIRGVSTNRSFPSRVFLSERIAAIRLFAGTRGHGGAGPSSAPE